ncbi:hypothetical protein GCM10011332_05580 [Terasakiella brassicae]|uniref:Uncharacterized protein n=1 Tax=Terasakiella brassicae TaxID=1634917 RepID=A0A917BSD8_9PROT|nr:hypothetical protein [Terasakiella brassicae]GGF55078.1 hypothetical protein GCM10011332_05580 [Terasakiella brassicae]
MNYQSFGKIAIQPDKIEAFVKEAEAKGLCVRHVKGNIYDFGMRMPSLLDPAQLRKSAGVIGLKYSV